MRTNWNPSTAVILAAAIVIITGCPNSDPTAPPTTGTLAITVAGLPAGVLANILVAGPSNYSRAITATGATTLTPLPLGTYTVTAVSVTNGTATYAPPTLSQTVTLNASALDGTAAVPYALVSGSLDLTIAGLPSGVMASVTVTGPGAFTGTATASRTFPNLVAGTYTVTASNVSQGTAAYAVAPSTQTIVVSASLIPATASVAYSAMTGQLTVTASGTPGGVNPSVLVTGPRNYSQAITAVGVTTLAALPLGTYTVTAVGVTNGTATYAPPTLSQTVTLNSGALDGTVAVPYALVSGSLDLTVTGLPPGGMALITVTGPGGFNQPATGSQTFSNIQAGVYTIASYDVWQLTPTYVGTPASQSIVVPASLTTTATASVAYAPLTGGGWTAVASIERPTMHMAAGVVNSVLYVVGGIYDTGQPQYDILHDVVGAYDPATNVWTRAASMPLGRRDAAVGVIDGVLYAVGGRAGRSAALSSSVEAYDPVTNTWTEKAPMPTARSSLAVGVVNGVLYAVGGCRDNALGCAPLATVEAYDPATNTWTAKASMPTPRSDLAVGVINGVLYAVGGAGPGGVLKTVAAYDPATDSWTAKTSMPSALLGLAVGVVNDVLYAVGGSGGGSGRFSIVEAYDPVMNSWTNKASMPTARAYLAAGVVNGILYAVGGENSNLPLAAAEAYRP